MFYTAEDVIPAATQATKLFGTVGNMDNSGNKRYWNVCVATKQYGKIWYGDISSTMNVLDAINSLSRLIQQPVYVLDERFDFNNPILMSN